MKISIENRIRQESSQEINQMKNSLDEVYAMRKSTEPQQQPLNF